MSLFIHFVGFYTASCIEIKCFSPPIKIWFLGFAFRLLCELQDVVLLQGVQEDFGLSVPVPLATAFRFSLLFCFSRQSLFAGSCRCLGCEKKEGHKARFVGDMFLCIAAA